MAPYKRRHYRRGNRDKYSVEQTAGNITLTSGQQTNIQVVSNSSIQGMRKVKHLTISVGGISGQGIDEGSCFWALVYVPQGTQPNNMSLVGSNMYEPNQFVMNCGVFDFSAGPTRISSPLSRNLNSGDSIYLVVVPNVNVNMGYVVRYAVTLQ